jgi:hypothetical protein
MAEQLRRSLQAETLPVASSSSDAATAASSGSYSYSSKNERISSALDALERRGRVEKATLPPSPSSRTTNDDMTGGKNDDHVMVMVPGTTSTSTNTHGTTSIRDMVAQERNHNNNNGMSTAELEMRNVMRTNKRRKVKLRTLQRQDSDKDFQQQLKSVVPDNGNDDDEDQKKRAAPSARTVRRAADREQNQQLARHDRQDQMTSKCWWWLESSTFVRHRLLALGDHVSLVMAPHQNAVTAGHHFYLVPLKHTESLTAAEDDVWEEIQRFQSSLRALYQHQNGGGKNVLFCETVLNNTGTGGGGLSGFWQTKMEAVVVPNSVWQDAPLFFKSALAEQAQDWGTHQKLMPTTGDKGLRRTVPKNFDYFYIQWGGGGGGDSQDGVTAAATAPASGYVQMIESNAFPQDFGVDTIAGMMEMDPMRFRKNQKAQPEQERQGILEFLEAFKPFDWTVELDK